MLLRGPVRLVALTVRFLAAFLRDLSGIPAPRRGPCRRAAILLILALPATLGAQDRTERRTVHESYAANRLTTLEVQNKYGKIEVVTWEKDSVAVDVDIFMTESSASRLRKLREDIRIRISSTNNYILARTVIDSERGRIARELKSVAAALTGENKRVEIDYMVRIPRYVDVVLLNKFGDIYLDDLDSQVEIDLSNGALKANNLTGISSIHLSFANGMIGSLGSATMNLAYSDLILREVNQLDLESKSSKLNADRANVLKINSRRDELYFKTVEYLYGNGNFSQVWVYDFLRESDIFMKYGKLTLEHVVPDFSTIFVESEYTDVSLYFHPASNFDFDILYHEKATLRLPERHMEAEDSYAGGPHYRVTGTVTGPGPAAAGSVSRGSRGGSGSGAGAGEGGPGTGAGEGGSGTGRGEGGSNPPEGGRGEVRIDALERCMINLLYK